jgi:redox-sensitive bicupin YhaK (pirin superfamily)
MKQRSIASILPAQTMQMGALTIHQPMPTQQVEQIDPFLLLHHFGPFVMNTQTEILEAMRDYKMGKMGVYIDD